MQSKKNLITAVPEDIHIIIIRMLNFTDIRHARRSCSYLYNLIENFYWQNEAKKYAVGLTISQSKALIFDRNLLGSHLLKKLIPTTSSMICSFFGSSSKYRTTLSDATPAKQFELNEVTKAILNDDAVKFFATVSRLSAVVPLISMPTFDKGLFMRALVRIDELEGKVAGRFVFGDFNFVFKFGELLVKTKARNCLCMSLQLYWASLNCNIIKPDFFSDNYKSLLKTIFSSSDNVLINKFFEILGKFNQEVLADTIELVIEVDKNKLSEFLKTNQDYLKLLQTKLLPGTSRPCTQFLIDLEPDARETQLHCVALRIMATELDIRNKRSDLQQLLNNTQIPLDLNPDTLTATAANIMFHFENLKKTINELETTKQLYLDLQVAADTPSMTRSP